IWDDDPPDHVRGSLQTYVGRLRRVLGDKAIETRPTGYALLVPRSAVDLLLLWDSALAARDASDQGSERAALAGVLERWNGEPFGDAPSEWLARHERPVWRERRLQTFERWVDLSFDAGDHQVCLEELNRQVELHPLREPLWTRLLVALDRVGRTAEALDRYESVRKRLAEELGVDPSPELRAVYATLLERSDEHADGPIGSRAATVPRQLPVRVRGFVGRDEQLARMDELLTRGADEGVVMALHGPAGCGKTSLALEWAHRTKDGFPDGQLFLNLQGYGPGEPLTSEQSLNALLRGLGVPGGRIPDDVDERSAMLRSETEGRRILVVLDNARESEQVRPLLPGSDALVLVTSRTQLRGLVAREAAYRVGLDQMSPAESVALLQQRLAGGDEAELLALAELCGHLPVALAVAAERVGRAGSEPSPVAAVVEELRGHKNRLDALDSGDDDPLTNVRAVLEWSYRSLDDESARALRHLGLYSASAISTGAVAALLGIEPGQVTRSIDRLTDRHLLTPNGGGWYVMHDLVRDFAAEIAHEDSASERTAATLRLRSWFLHSAARARLVWAPPTVPDLLPEIEAGVTVEEIDSPQAAFEWFDAHRSYLRRFIAGCVSDGDPTGHLLAPMLFTHLRTGGIDHDALALFRLAEESARRLGDHEGQAACANYVAGCHFERGEPDEAIEAVERSRDLCAAAGDVDGELRAQGNLALVLKKLGRVDEAAAAYERVIDDARRLEARGQLGMNLLNASDFYQSEGRLEDAMRAGEEAVQVIGPHGNPVSYANAIDNLAEVRASTGDLLGAVETMESALDAYRDLRLRGDEAHALRKMGSFRLDLGDPASAREYWRAADALLVELGVSEVRDVSRSELYALLASLDEPPGGG
ncbi:MAG: BTAD domain-containing putative transcriptional regulator, partial [Nocardioidaceae bacterium]